MTTGRINQVSILSTRPETSVANNRGVKHAPLEASRPKVIESVILISSAPRTRLGLPPVSCSRNEAPSLEPTEGPPDDNQRTRNIPIRCDSIGVSRRLHRHASHSPPSSAEIGNAQGFEGSCTREIIRLAIGYRYKLLFRASIAKRRMLQARSGAASHFVQTGLCEPATDAFVSRQPRRAGTSCHSSGYSAHEPIVKTSLEPSPVGEDHQRAFRRAKSRRCRDFRLRTPS